MVSQSPLFMEKKKLLLLPWSLGQSENSWPAITPVWICLKRIPYHCWSNDILLSIARSIGKPPRLDETTTVQHILYYARVLVNLDVAIPNPNSIAVVLEGDANVEVEVQYENIPCSECLSACHITAECPFAANPGILRTPLATIVEASSISRDDDNKSTAAEGTAATDAEGLGEYDATLPSVLISSAEVPGENDAAFNLATNSADVINVISPLPSIASPPSSTGKPSFISSSKRNS